MLVSVFVAMLGHLNRILYGEPPRDPAPGDDPRRLLPLLLNLATLLVIGVALPGPLARLLAQASGIVAP